MSADPSTGASHDRARVPGHEWIFRRCVFDWFRHKDCLPAVKNFMPRAWVSDQLRGDVDGLSVTRPAITNDTPERASCCPFSGKHFHVAKLLVTTIESAGLTVIADAQPHDKGHALIPELNSLDRRDPDKEAWMEERAKRLREAAQMVHIIPPREQS